MSDRADACRILGISVHADLDTARAAYRELVGVVHPDRGGDAVMFGLVREAWALIQRHPVPEPPGTSDPPERSAPGHDHSGSHEPTFRGGWRTPFEVMGAIDRHDPVGCISGAMYWVILIVVLLVIGIVKANFF